MLTLLYRAKRNPLLESSMKSIYAASHGNGWQYPRQTSRLETAVKGGIGTLVKLVIENYNNDDYYWQILSEEGEVAWTTVPQK